MARPRLTDEQLLERFLSRFEIDAVTECWCWTASISGNGYAQFNSRRRLSGHRFSFRHFVGPIPDGAELDHLCRNTICVNPDHLEIVTPRINQHRGFSFAGINARKSHCPQGHPYSGVNSQGRRICHKCDAARQRRYAEGANAQNT